MFIGALANQIVLKILKPQTANYIHSVAKIATIRVRLFVKGEAKENSNSVIMWLKLMAPNGKVLLLAPIQQL